jgi:hypothetical protein
MRVGKGEQDESQFFCNLILQVTSHHFCHILLTKTMLFLDVVVHICNPSIWEAKTGGLSLRSALATYGNAI